MVVSEFCQTMLKRSSRGRRNIKYNRSLTISGTCELVCSTEDAISSEVMSEVPSRVFGMRHVDERCSCSSEGGRSSRTSNMTLLSTASTLRFHSKLACLMRDAKRDLRIELLNKLKEHISDRECRCAKFSGNMLE